MTLHTFKTNQATTNIHMYVRYMYACRCYPDYCRKSFRPSFLSG
jgi:hypothetical protein